MLLQLHSAGLADSQMPYDLDPGMHRGERGWE